MGARRSGADDFHSERHQIQALQRAAVQLGGDLEILPSELDVSGGNPLIERPSLLAAVEGVETGRYCGIIVAYQSRLARDVETEESVWRRVEAAGGRIQMAMDGIDTATVDGKMMRRIRSAFNAAERERHAERFEELREQATAAGIWQRRQTPLGYRKAVNRKLEPDSHAAEVRWAFNAKASGVPIVQIAERLQMTPNGVRGLLRNRVYLGELKVGEHINPEGHVPIVTVDQFEAAQTNGPRPARSQGTPALLAGLVRCAACGHVMSRTGTAYQCFGRSSAGRCPAPAAITATNLDRHVESIALHQLDRITLQAAESGGRVDDAREHVAAAEREMAAYLQAVSADDVGAEAFGAGARSRRQRVVEAQDALRRSVALQPVAAPDVQTGREAWDELDGESRNVLLRALFEAVVVRRAGGRGARGTMERVQVLVHGAGVIETLARNGSAHGIRTIGFLDAGDERVARIPGSQ